MFTDLPSFVSRPKVTFVLVSFQNAVSKYGSQFQGNSQHDALEFLLWLLDRVHEDLEGSAPGLASEQVSRSLKNMCVHLPSPCGHLLSSLDSSVFWSQCVPSGLALFSSGWF